MAEKTTTNDQLHFFFFFLPSLSRSIAGSPTLSDLIPTLVPSWQRASLEMLH